MKSVKGRKPRRKHLYIGYGLIISGTLGLILTIQAGTILISSAKHSVLSAYTESGSGGTTSSEDPSQYFTPGSGGTSTSTFNEPILMNSSIGYSTRTTTTTNTETNNSYTSPASSTTTTSKPKTTTSSRPTPTPTKKVTSAKTTPTPTPDDSTQQIIDIIDEQFTQPTDAPTENTNPSPTGPFPTQHQARAGNGNTGKQSSTNNNNSPEFNISFYGNTTPTDSTLLPSDSLSSTQQELNTILKDQGIHVTIQNVDKQTIITATNNEGKMIHFTSDLVNKLTDLLLQDTWPKIVKINDADFLIKKGSVVAQTHFPVDFDPINDAPMISLGTEDKQITVLPDQAAAHILQTGLMDTIGPSSFFRYILPRYTPPPATTTMQLAALNDEPVYTISGSVRKKVFNIIPIPIQRTIFISAANGVTVQMNENPFYSLLDKISQ